MMGYKGDCYMDASEFAGISLGKTSAGPGEGTGYGSGIGTGWGTAVVPSGARTAATV